MGENTGQNSIGSFCIILFCFIWEDAQMNARLVWSVYDKKKLDKTHWGLFAFTFEMVLIFSSSVSCLSSHKFRCCLCLSTNNVIFFFFTSVTCTASLKVKLHWIKDTDSKVYINIMCHALNFLSTPFPFCSTMLRSRAVFPSCWNWAPVRPALSLWQGTTMLWGDLEPQRGQSVQWLVWAWGRCVEAAAPDITSFLRPQRTVRVGRSIVQDWLEGRAYFLSPTPLWSPKVSQLAMTPSTSHTCLATVPLYIQTASASLLMWPRLLKLEGECWGRKEIWRLVPMWSRDVEVAWSSRETSSKPIRLIRFTAHRRHDARSGSEYDADVL